MTEARTAELEAQYQDYALRQEWEGERGVCPFCGNAWQKQPANNYKGWNYVLNHEATCDYIKWLNEPDEDDDLPEQAPPMGCAEIDSPY